MSNKKQMSDSMLNVIHPTLSELSKNAMATGKRSTLIARITNMTVSHSNLKRYMKHITEYLHGQTSPFMPCRIIPSLLTTINAGKVKSFAINYINKTIIMLICQDADQQSCVYSCIIWYCRFVVMRHHANIDKQVKIWLCKSTMYITGMQAAGSQFLSVLAPFSI